jgi:putative membrane protein
MVDRMGGMALYMVLPLLVGIAIVVLAVVGIVWLVRSIQGTRSIDGGPGDSALELLRRRYAAGEIDEDEFHRRRSGLA